MVAELLERFGVYNLGRVGVDSHFWQATSAAKRWAQIEYLEFEARDGRQARVVGAPKPPP